MTRRIDNSRLAKLLSINFIRLRTLFHCPFWVARKILRLKFKTRFFCAFHLMSAQCFACFSAPISSPNLSFTRDIVPELGFSVGHLQKSAAFRRGANFEPLSPALHRRHSLFLVSFTLWMFCFPYGWLTWDIDLSQESIGFTVVPRV